ncbi:MAG: hypothetical protein AMXMBFR64_55180 [Myxococcales bacterium]
MSIRRWVVVAAIFVAGCAAPGSGDGPGDTTQGHTSDDVGGSATDSGAAEPVDGGATAADGADGADAAAADTPDASGLDATAADSVDPPDAATDAPSPVDAPQDAADTTADGAPALWRSALYPADWSPGFADALGRRLHDFSYAGYHRGEVPLPTPPTAVGVVDFGADPTGVSDSTGAFQAAIDAVSAAGGVVHVPAGDYRVDGTLSVTASGTVLRGDGLALTRVAFSRTEGMSHGSHLTFKGSTSHDLDLPLAADAAPFDTELRVADASALSPGDDVSVGHVITPEFIDEHGMKGTWQAFNDSWQPFSWRTVVSVDLESEPHRVTVDVPLRSGARVSDGASLRRVPGLLRECGVEGVSFGNAVAWELAWTLNQVHALEMSGVADCWVRDVSTFAPPLSPLDGPAAGAHLQSGGVLVRQAMRVTVADSFMGPAVHRGSGGNGYLFEVRQSSEILFRDCEARGGRHNFIQNWGFGATGIVWLRVWSHEGTTIPFYEAPELLGIGLCEYHHSLATANLVDSSVLDDGWSAENRGDWSTGAGHTATESVFWATTGVGRVESRQWGWGYVIGTGPDLKVDTDPAMPNGGGTAPEDLVEGAGAAATLEPPSLYEDQLARRLAVP